MGYHFVIISNYQGHALSLISAVRDRASSDSNAIIDTMIAMKGEQGTAYANILFGLDLGGLTEC